MKKWKRALYGIISLILAVSLGIPSHATGQIDEQIDQQEEEIRRTEQEISDAEARQQKLEQAKKDMENYLSDLNEQYADISEQIENLEEQIEKKSAEIEETQADLEEAKQRAQKQYEDMKARIQYMYENSQSSFFELVLAEGSISEALTRADSVFSLSSYDDQKMDEYIAIREEIADKEARLTGEKEALDELHAQVLQKQQEVEALANNTRGQISSHVNAIASAQAEIDGKENDLENQRAVLNELLQEKRRIEAALEAAKGKEITESLGDVTGQRTTEQEYVQYGAYPASEEEVTALAVLIYCEAGNQGADGQLAVGAVVMNRIRDPRFAQGDIMSVIRAPGQFSPVGSGRFDIMLTEGLDMVTQSCYDAARRAIAGESNVGNRVFFRTYANMPSLSGLVIGAHIFSYTWNYSSM